VSVYAGGVRFYRPIQIGHIVEVEARLLHTGAQTMHICVHVRSGDPKNPRLELTTHCLTVLAAVDEAGVATPVRAFIPRSEEDRRLDAHARELIALRSRTPELNAAL
jgi:acyl-CoA hydrolase